MELAVFGGTGAIGRDVLEQALARGDRVRAFVRDPARLPLTHARLTAVEGELDDQTRIASAIEGADAVLSALGSGNRREEADLLATAVRGIIEAMERHGVRRLVALSGAAVQLEGERKQLADRVASAVVRVLARHVVAAKQREYEVIDRSGVEWVLVRPPRVVEGPLTGRYQAGDIRIGPGSRISRADVAQFMLAQLTDDRYLRQAPFISY